MTTPPPELPERVASSTLPALLAEGGLTAVDAALARCGGALVGPTNSGRTEVTFVWRPRSDAERAAVVIDTITDAHRSDITGFVLDRDPDWPLLHASMLLPADLRATCFITTGADLDVTAGQTRPGWLSVLAGAQPLPGGVDTVPVGDGGRGTVLALPSALPQPYAAGNPAAAHGQLRHQRLDSRVLGHPMDLWCYRPDARYGEPTAALVLLDGATWIDQISFLPAFDALHHDRAIEPTALIAASAPLPQQRPTTLGLSPAFPRFLAEEALPWARTYLPVPENPNRITIAGQSLGGLAAAFVVAEIPELIANAIVQSGSFWWPAADAGALTRHYRTAPIVPKVRFFHEVGNHEWHLRDDHFNFHEVAAARGIDSVYREFRGGHDYACWRGGLADGLIHFFGNGRDSDGPASAQH